VRGPAHGSRDRQSAGEPADKRYNRPAEDDDDATRETADGPMICPKCQTPGSEESATCLYCGYGFEGAAEAQDSHAAELTSVPTMGSPSSFKEWANQSQKNVASVVLPAGLEIGHRYRVKSLLGMGGMGAVYLVHDKELDRDVAMKLIRSDIAEDAEALERFKREIQLSSRVTHPNVLRVFDLGESDGIKFLTMQFVDGRDLSTILKKQGKLPTERLLRVFRQTAEGLKAAHDQGVTHRDLKPQNIMLDATDRVYVTDFGLAKSSEQSGMTQTGAIIGTPFYMSPEQVKGEPVGPQSDIFALGVILYQMAAGTVPFGGATPFEVMITRIQRPPKPIRELNPELPVYLQKIIERCLTVDLGLRYQNVQEILDDLDAESVRTTIRHRARSQRWLRPAAAAAAIALVLAAGGLWIYRRGRAAKPPAAVKPRSVLVADFANHTGDPVFDGTLEPAFTIALEGASFVNSYSRASARKEAAQLQPGATGLDENLARLVAVREGINVVTSGSVDKSGDGYEVSVRAVDAATGKTIATDEEKASGKDRVLASVARLAAQVRGALGDATPQSTQLAAAETYSAGSLEAAHEYAIAQNLQWEGNWEEAIRHYHKALDLDPNLGRAYAGLAAVESNRGRRQEAEKYYKEALARIDRMTEREKYRTRGGYYLLVRNPDNAIEEFSALVKQYPADSAGLANLAAAYFYKRDFARALKEAQRAIDLYPKNVPQRNNLGLDAMYAGDFEAAIKEQNEVLRLNPKFALAYVSKALSELALGHPDIATETYRKGAEVDAHGASLGALGLADIALFQGRPADAVPILEKGIEADLANQNPEAAAEKRLALAQAHLELHDTAAALSQAERALTMARGENILYPAAQVFIAAGREPAALALATELAGRLEPDPQAYAELIRGEVELSRGKAAEAIRHFTAAKKIADTWAGRLDFGKAYLDAGAFPQADDELETCIKRRGEATALFLEESPSYRVFPPVYYYLGRARAGLKSPAADEAFKTFLAFQTGEGGTLAADARRRLAAR
jgi:tetratricopeptide (TPR) repeat protein/predicted Ser/Thr protein kinase